MSYFFSYFNAWFILGKNEPWAQDDTSTTSWYGQK